LDIRIWNLFEIWCLYFVNSDRFQIKGSDGTDTDLPINRRYRPRHPDAPAQLLGTVALLFAGILMGAGCWPTRFWWASASPARTTRWHWGTYLINFVFWVGIAHSGTLISAILHLFRAGWRNPIARAAETMTVFAVCTAGLYPFIHLGRVWMVYYMLPVPNQRTLWPNFQSPLMFDVVAISTYLTVSSACSGTRACCRIWPPSATGRHG
jgi:hypothetical protein